MIMEKGKINITFEALAKYLGVPENAVIVAADTNYERGIVSFIVHSSEPTPVTSNVREGTTIPDYTMNLRGAK